MSKKILAIMSAAVLVFSLSVTALAADPPAVEPWVGYGCGIGVCDGLMWDADGSFLDRDAFEERLDQAIDDGLILAEDKEYYLERYDYCAEYGGGSVVVRGGMGCGRGMGRGMGRRRWA